MDARVISNQQRLTYVCVDTRYILEDLPGVAEDWNGWRERGGQENVSCRCDLMMMKMNSITTRVARLR